MTLSDTRQLTAQAVRELADWAAATPAQSIPPEVMQRAARVLADDLSAIIGARAEPEVQAFHARSLKAKRHEEATVFRGGRPRTRATAARA